VIGTSDEEELVANAGRFGPYVRYKSKFYSLPKGTDPLTIDLAAALEIIAAKEKADAERLIKAFVEDPTVQLLNGSWGPYLTNGTLNAKLPKDCNPTELSFDECLELLKTGKPARGKKAAPAKTPAKKAAAKSKEPIAEKATVAPKTKKASAKPTDASKVAAKKPNTRTAKTAVGKR